MTCISDMKILVYEYLTGGGLLSQSADGSLFAEGRVMLAALVRDLLEAPNATLSVLLDARTTDTGLPDDSRIAIITATSVAERDARWHEQLTQCDAAWVIAPETQNTLEELSRDVLDADRVLLTSPPDAVALTANKAATADRLRQFGIAVAPTLRAAQAGEGLQFPVVVKPIDGVGGIDSLIIEAPSGWAEWRTTVNLDRFVAQPLLTGAPMSLSALFDHGQARLLSCNRQHIRRDEGRFVLEGCTVGSRSRHQPRFDRLVQSIAQAVPELWGYAGIDFIHDEKHDIVLEINPRLTTSYAGLRAALGINVAQWVIDLWRNRRLPEAIPDPSNPVLIETGAKHEHC